MKSNRLLVPAAMALAVTAVTAHLPGEPAASPDAIVPPLVGAELPPLTLKTGDGADFDLAAAMRKKHTILIFYRGGW